MYSDQKAGGPDTQTISGNASETDAQHDVDEGWKSDNVPQRAEQALIDHVRRCRELGWLFNG